jgi:hypothetical protein
MAKMVEPGFYGHVAGIFFPVAREALIRRLLQEPSCVGGKNSGNGVPGGYPLIRRFFPGTCVRD